MKTITYDETEWQMVPKVPTEEMKDAAMDILLHHGDIYANSWGSIVIETITPADLLRAMLRAASTPPEVDQTQPDELKSVLAAARQAGWSFEKRADGVTHMVRLVVGEVQALPCSVDESANPQGSPVYRSAEMQDQPSAQDREDAEHRHALREAERNPICDSYFKARDGILGTIKPRTLFEDGFDRGYDAARATKEADHG